MPEPRIAGGTSEVVDAPLQVPEEGMAMTDQLSSLHLLEATHPADSPFAMLMIPLDALLLHRPGETVGLRQDGGHSRGYVGALSVGTVSGRTIVFSTA